jgi:hypothetical protein
MSATAHADPFAAEPATALAAIPPLNRAGGANV